MQHHIDEFSVTDIRHTLGEVWRVVTARRWYFIFPFCIVSSLALLGSLLVPRSYESDTLIEREQDVVFAKMLGRSWTQPYDEISERMPSDIRDPELIAEVLEELDLPSAKEIEASHPARKVSVQEARKATVKEIQQGLSVQPIKGASSREEIFAINLKLRDPTHLTKILGAIRDKYIVLSQARTVEALLNVRKFFLEESERCREKLTGLQKQVVEYELKYPGIDPKTTDPTNAEHAALVVERIGLERDIERSQLRRRQLASSLESLKPAPGEDAEAAQPEPVLVERDNPRRAELKGRIADILRNIADNKALKFQTEEHPDIQLLRRRLEMLNAEFEETPATVRVPAGLETTFPGMPTNAAIEQRVAGLERQLADVEAEIATSEAELERVRARLKEVDQRRALTAEHREAFLRLQQQVEQLREEQQAWQANVGPIDHVLYLEDRDRSIHFGTIRDVSPIVKPCAPDAQFLILICFAIGVGAAGLSVLLAELCDRSYRTVKQLTSSLGIPVVESIDEIMTEPVRRRRMARNLLLMPTVAIVLVFSTLISGAAAYLSIEKPADLEILKSSPLDVGQLIHFQD